MYNSHCSSIVVINRNISELRHLYRLGKILVITAATLSIVACGEEDKSSDKEEDLGTPVSSQSELIGSWALESMSVLEDKNIAVVVSGINILSFRANNTVISELSAFTLSVGDVPKDTENCTSYSSGKFQLTVDTLVNSEAVRGAVSGTCYDIDETPSVASDPDFSSKVSKSDNKLLLANEFTYKDGSGGSKKGTVVAVYTKNSEDTWDGNGLDPRFQGSWQYGKRFGERTCNDPEPERGEHGLAGTAKVTVDGVTFKSDFTDFAIGAGEKCTASDTGTIEPGKLTNTWKQGTFTAECIKTEPDPAGYVEFIDREFVTSSGKWIGINSMFLPDDECADKGEYRSRSISIIDKQ